MRLNARDHYTSSTLIGGKGGAGPNSLHTTLEGPTEYISEYKMDVKSTWILTWHQNDHVSLLSKGLLSKTTSLEVGLTQNRETMAILPMFTTVDLFYLIKSGDPHK